MPAIAAAEPCARSIVAQKSGRNLRPALPEQQRILPMCGRESPMLRGKRREYAVKTAISRAVSLAYKKYRMEYVEANGSAGKRLAGRGIGRVSIRCSRIAPHRTYHNTAQYAALLTPYV